MNKQFALIALTILFTLPLQLSAAGFQNPLNEGLAEFKKKEELRMMAVVGKTFFAYFERMSCRYPFEPAIQSKPDFLDTNRYKADSAKSLIVEGIVQSQRPDYRNNNGYYRVKIEDGTVGFIQVSRFRSGSLENEKSLREDCFLELEPQEVKARLDKFEADKTAKLEALAEDQRQAQVIASRREAEARAEGDAWRKKEAAIAKRPNARIGMTAKQVIENTNWGEPESVNRTITQSGVNEQWVYGSGNYLYFKNGRLSAIQN